jgi:uncharacterized membrane protein
MESDTALLRKPAALIPLSMALITLALPLVHVAIFGNVRQPDEGTAAHLFQLLMVIQVPLIAFFAIKWLPRAPKKTLLTLALQAAIMIAAFAVVFVMESMAR